MSAGVRQGCVGQGCGRDECRIESVLNPWKKRKKSLIRRMSPKCRVG